MESLGIILVIVFAAFIYFKSKKIKVEVKLSDEDGNDVTVSGNPRTVEDRGMGDRK